MNMAIFAVWTLFVLIPQFAVEPFLQAQRDAVLPCVHRNDSYTCPRQSSNSTVFIALPSCKSPPLRGSAMATYCEGNQSVRVTTVTRNSSSCPHGPDEYYVCPAYTPRFSNIIDLVTGRKGYNDTWLFLGHYVNFTEFDGISYNRPVAMLVCTAAVYLISFLMLIIRYLRGCQSWL